MKKFYCILSIFLIFCIVSLSIASTPIGFDLKLWFIELHTSTGLLLALTSAFSCLASLSLLISLGLTGQPQENIKIKNKIEETKLKHEIESDKVKQLEAKIKTLEEALKKVASNI